MPNALVPALRDRLKLGRLLIRAPLPEPALAMAMEEIPHMAFLASESGVVLQANAAGRAELDREPSLTRDTVAEAVATLGGVGPFKVKAVADAGSAHRFLLVARASPRLADALAQAAELWEITPRQEEVLALLARGDSTKAMAAALGIGMRTVEHHVTELIRRAGVSSRAQLVARLSFADAGADSSVMAGSRHIGGTS